MVFDAQNDLEQIRGLVPEWQRQVESGKANANILYCLGSAYYNGIDVEKDIEQAIGLWKEAADQGDADALYEMGLAYFEGITVDKDVNEAVSLFHRSAEQNNADAHYYLSLIYLYGEGPVALDLSAGRKHLSESERLGKRDIPEEVSDKAGLDSLSHSLG